MERALLRTLMRTSRGVLPTSPLGTVPRTHNESAEVRSCSGCPCKTGLGKCRRIQMRGGRFGRHLHSPRLLELLPRTNLKQVLCRAAAQKAGAETEVVRKLLCSVHAQERTREGAGPIGAGEPSVGPRPGTVPASPAGGFEPGAFRRDSR